MIAARSFAGKRLGVFGLGRSGLSAVRALAAGGAEVVAWDDDAAKRAAAAAEGIPVGNLYSRDLRGFHALVLSPGVPLTHPEAHDLVHRAAEANCPVFGDVEIFSCESPQAQVVGITGTNGKSTTTALLTHALRECGFEAECGANLGTPVLDLPVLGRGGAYVLELSSFQIELTPSLACDVAVLLNITPDHLDRHGTMARYANLKRRLFEGQFRNGGAVLCLDDPHCAAIYDRLRQSGRENLIAVTIGKQVQDGISVEAAILYDHTGPCERTVDLSDVAALRGEHNWQNAACAYGAGLMLGADPAVLGAAIQTFPGLAHRMELADEIDGVLFVNDSKATNAAAAARALAAFDSIYWIAGGQAKNGGIDDLKPLFGHVRHAFLIGESGPRFARTLGPALPHTVTRDLESALALAHAKAAAESRGDAVVLLSPACASFDQWRDFEERGDAFRDLVRRLPGHHRDPRSREGGP